MNPIHDYAALEIEYVQSDITIRELARSHGIKSWSSVNTQKNKRGWDDKREAYRIRLGDQQVNVMVRARLATVATIHDELLTAIRAAIHRYVADVQKQDGAQAVSARDLMGLIDKFLLLTGQATSRSESRNLDLHAGFDTIFRDAPPELLREFAELARVNGAGAQPMGRGPLVVLEGTRTA
jgi:hypothetical protein